MKVLFVGDVFAESGLRAVSLHLPDIRDRYDAVVVNGENSHEGKGLSKRTYRILRDAGADLITLGNHCWDHSDVYNLMATEPVIRALNYPANTPGQGHWTLEVNNQSLLVAQVIGQVNMGITLDNPFAAAERVLAEYKTNYSLLEVHAEATSEKYALGHYLDGKVSAILGTHTHIPTADTGFLKHGTAFQADVGMCGAIDSIIGGDIASFMGRFTTQRPTRFKAASGRACFNAVALTFSEGCCSHIERYRWEESL